MLGRILISFLLMFSFHAKASFEGSCKDFADHLLSFYELGSFGKPSPLVKKNYKYETDKKTQLPIIEVAGKNSADIHSEIGSEFENAEDDVEENSWSIAVTDNYKLERKLYKPTLPPGTFPTNYSKWSFRRIFYFEKVGEKCRLQKIKLLHMGLRINKRSADHAQCQKIIKNTGDDYLDHAMADMCLRYENYFPDSQQAVSPLPEKHTSSAP